MIDMLILAIVFLFMVPGAAFGYVVAGIFGADRGICVTLFGGASVMILIWLGLGMEIVRRVM